METSRKTPRPDAAGTLRRPVPLDAGLAYSCGRTGGISSTVSRTAKCLLAADETERPSGEDVAVINV